ncbi:unnamed protein product [Clavelina lepadiformis]|uniref:Uncharacterized protein n=1 Tax=Clavelina lepadiformis TaxID=159417 RepID=A0ABP0FAW0_CLALP
MEQTNMEPVECTTASPEVSSTSCARKLSTSNLDVSEIPPKKRRRSSVRRRSLAETLHCLIVETNESEDVEILNPNKKICEQSKHHLTMSEETANISSTSTTNKQAPRVLLMPEGNYALERLSVLNNEAKTWKKLLKKYKRKEVDARLKTMTGFKDDDLKAAQNIDEDTLLGYKGLSEKVDSMEKRFLTAAKSVSNCIHKAHAIRTQQDAWLQSVLEREMQESLQQYASIDPKDILCDILKYDQLLLQTTICKKRS